jgi:ankyrin repeat protein
MSTPLSQIDEEFNTACAHGDYETALTLVRGNRCLDVNRKDVVGFTPLHWACYNDRHKIAEMLLCHRHIEVNKKNNFGSTPFFAACEMGSLKCVKLLLKNTAVDVNLPNNDGYTPLMRAAKEGYIDIVKYWIASGRGMDLKKELTGRNAMNISALHGRREMTALLYKYGNNRKKTIKKMRIKLRWHKKQAAALFALIVFACDGILKIKRTCGPKYDRFFNIAGKLPMEIQMILCHRVFDSMKNGIASKYSEPAFRGLARKLLVS